MTLYPRQLTRDEINHYIKAEFYADLPPKATPQITFRQAYLPVVQMAGAAVFWITVVYVGLWLVQR